MTDTLAAAEATETVIGSAETPVDTVVADAGADTIMADISAFSADSVAGENGADTVASENGADSIASENGADSVEAAAAYDGLVAPEGFESLDAEALAAATPIFRELGIATTEKAQEALNKLAPITGGITTKAVTAAIAAQETQIAEVSAGWVRECQALPGFDKLKADAARFRDTFAKSPEAKALIAELPIFNHPVLLNIFAAGGRALAGDQIASGDQSSTKPKTFAEAAYGDFKAEPAP